LRHVKLRANLGRVQIREFSGEESSDIVDKFFIPAISRMGPGFCGRVALHELDKGLTLSRSHWGGPMSAVRTDRMAARTSDGSRMLFAVQVDGRGRMFQRDRFVELAAGSGILIEASSPSKWVSQTETRWLTLRFSREQLLLRDVEITEACARRMDPAAPAMQMLAAYLGQLFEVAGGLTAPQRLDAGRAAIDLLAMALRGVVPSVPGCDGSRVLLDMMRRYVRAHSADPCLRVEELARRHNVSVSYVYTLFERIGTTPGAYLREQRLLAAQVMLSDPRCARLGTPDIASVVGFVERRTFERAFRRQYGMTPGDWRRQHCHSGSAPPTGREEAPLRDEVNER
jgi:AraC-like DNA-binding protein